MTDIVEIIEKIIPRYAKRAEDKKKELVGSVPDAEHTLVYDSS